MKKINFLIFIIIMSTGLNAQSQKYFWYNHTKRYLQEVPNKKYVLLQDIYSKKEFAELIDTSTQMIWKFKISNILPSSSNLFIKNNERDVSWAILKSERELNNLKQYNQIIYESSFYKINDKEVGVSHLFYVKLLNSKDFDVLKSYAEYYNVTIIGNNKYMPLWYTLACKDNSFGDAIDLANIFYETEKFQIAVPNLMVSNLLGCVNDTYFGDQWGLNNTGQYGGTTGIDINICQAWQTTTGDANVTIAIIDQGVQLNHPDLNNMTLLSFDTETGTSPSRVWEKHGTAVAGIAGASSNNSAGIAGVAPDCQIMSISNQLVLDINVEQQLADGINFAWQNGADIISNSWGSNLLAPGIIDNAITDAIRYGRDGLGCVVTFSAGNDNGNVTYPANSNPEIIVVGAISQCGERKSPTSCDGEWIWGSNFGNELDITAPGVLVPTTDRTGNDGYNPNIPIHTLAGGSLISSDYTNQDYTAWFNGTSAACPHVSGVAALMLSANPCLSQRDISDIIESTGQKVGGYYYQNIAGRSNGTWVDQLGYGLLDAEAAVDIAINQNMLTLSNIVYEQDVTITGCNNIEMNNIEINNNASLEIDANSININGEFSCTLGTELYIH
ncbi:MAG: S8 family serine peptidase [Bacteroidales bacterium]|nr:S8 family serine peptidase [Bacteroidales bacterium]